MTERYRSFCGNLFLQSCSHSFATFRKCLSWLPNAPCDTVTRLSTTHTSYTNCFAALQEKVSCMCVKAYCFLLISFEKVGPLQVYTQSNKCASYSWRKNKYLGSQLGSEMVEWTFTAKMCCVHYQFLKLDRPDACDCCTADVRYWQVLQWDFVIDRTTLQGFSQGAGAVSWLDEHPALNSRGYLFYSLLWLRVTINQRWIGPFASFPSGWPSHDL